MSQLYTLLGMIAGAGTVLLGFLKFRPERDLAVAQTAKELIDPLRERVGELREDNENLTGRVTKLEAEVGLCRSAINTKDGHIADMETENRGLKVRLEEALERIAALEALMTNAGVTIPASLVRMRRDETSEGGMI